MCTLKQGISPLTSLQKIQAAADMIVVAVIVDGELFCGVD